MMPNFYAADVLGLLRRLAIARAVPSPGLGAVRINPKRIFLKGHSQGGNVTTIVVAAANIHAAGLRIAGASLWAGTISDRLTQAAFHTAMQTSPQAFLSGDGSWTGTARSQSGAVNRDFVFGYPSPNITTPDPTQWTARQQQQWHIPTVKQAYRAAFGTMYRALGLSAEPPEGQALQSCVRRTVS